MGIKRSNDFKKNMAGATAIPFELFILFYCESSLVSQFLSTNPSIWTCNKMLDFESKHLHSPAFPLISCFQFLKRKITGAKTRSNHTCDAVLDSHSENKTPLSLSSAVNKTPQLHSGTTLNPLKCYRSATAVQPCRALTRTNLALSPTLLRLPANSRET